MNFRVHCLICDESIKLNKQDMILVENGRDIIRVCDKCKDVVKYMRNKDMLKTLTDPEYGTVKVRY